MISLAVTIVVGDLQNASQWLSAGGVKMLESNFTQLMYVCISFEGLYFSQLQVKLTTYI